MTPELIHKLQFLADKYEIASFANEDPSQFLRWYGTVRSESNSVAGAASSNPVVEAAASVAAPAAESFVSAVESADAPAETSSVSTASGHLTLGRTATGNIADIECASFIAAMLAFGNRKQFIPKIRSIFEHADKTSGSITAWLLADAPGFPTGAAKFYRFYSYDDMHSLFSELAAILRKSPTLGSYFQKLSNMQEGEASPSLQPTSPSSATLSSGHTLEKSGPQRPAASSDAQRYCLASLISSAFPKSAIVPKGKTSANKRIHMFLRWMVRRNSPVDLGLWTWYSQADLLIPLDVHVMQEGIKMGLLPPKSTASFKTAVSLTHQMERAFPSDPSRADYALFGLGVDTEK